MKFLTAPFLQNISGRLLLKHERVKGKYVFYLSSILIILIINLWLSTIIDPRLSETFRFLLFTFLAMIQVAENNNVFAEKEISIGKTPWIKVESFPRTFSDLFQTWKIVLTKNCFISKFCARVTLCLLYSCERGLEDIKELKILQFAGHWDELQKKYMLTQAIMGKTYETMSRIQRKLGVIRKLWNLFLRNFWTLVPKLYS